MLKDTFILSSDISEDLLCGLIPLDGPSAILPNKEMVGLLYEEIEVPEDIEFTDESFVPFCIQKILDLEWKYFYMIIKRVEDDNVKYLVCGI